MAMSVLLLASAIVDHVWFLSTTILASQSRIHLPVDISASCGSATSLDGGWMLPWASVEPSSATVDGALSTLEDAVAPETDWTGSAFDGDDESCL